MCGLNRGRGGMLHNIGFRALVVWLLCVLNASTGYALSGRDIVDRARNLKLPDTARSDLTMVIHKGGRVTKKDFTITTKSFGNDERKTLVEFTRPAKIKLLTYSYPDRDDDQWLRLTSGKIKRITPSAKSKSFVNSHFTYEDILSRNVDDYTYDYLGKEKAMGEECYKVESVQTNGDKVYDKTVLFFRKTDYFIMRIDFYKKGKFIKYLANYNIRKTDGVLTPYKVVMTSAHKGKTELYVNNMLYNISIPQSKFKKEALR